MTPLATNAECDVTLRVHPDYDSPIQPVTTGVPLPEGAVMDIRDLRLLGPGDASVPLQVRQLSAWPDGSVRWVLLDFQTGSAMIPQARGATWQLKTDAGSPAPSASSPLLVETTDDAIRVDTGPLKFAISKRRLSGIEDVRLHGKVIVEPEHSGGIVLDVGGIRQELGSLQPEDAVVEEVGPLRAVIRSRGTYDAPGGERFSFTFRVHSYAGVPWVRLDHTFTNVTDEVVRLQELAIELPLAVAVDRYTLGGEGESLIEGRLGDDGVSLVQSPNHVMQDFEAHVFRVQEGVKEMGAGSRARGWMSLSGPEATVTVAVRDFWQLYPKGFRADPKHLAVDLWPRGALPEPAGHMDVNAGGARTHEMLLAFGTSGLDAGAVKDLVGQLERPPMALASPDWYASTQAAANGELAPAFRDGQATHPQYEELVQWMVHERYLKRRRERDEYGIMHFGDYLLGNRIWNSLQYELPRSFTQQFFRTGDRQFLDWAGEMVRGHRDILVLWHQDAARGHRAQRSYGGEWEQGEPHGKTSGGEGMLHIGGVIDYHLLTGDWRTREAILWMADGLANVRESLVWFRPQGFGWRACGYPLKVLAEAHTLTGDEKYREQAVRILETQVFPRAHTAENGYDPAVADGVWWADTEDLKGRRRSGRRRVDLPEDGWVNQAWMVDQMGDGLYSVYRILEEGPVKERTLQTFLALADWVVDYAWKADEGGLVVRYTKDSTGGYKEDGVYGGFIAMLGVSTTARAYALTGEERYMEVAREMFRVAVERARDGVNEGKQVGQTMQYAPIFLAIEAESSD